MVIRAQKIQTMIAARSYAAVCSIAAYVLFSAAVSIPDYDPNSSPKMLFNYFLAASPLCAVAGLIFSVSSLRNRGANAIAMLSLAASVLFLLFMAGTAWLTLYGRV